MKFFHIYYTLYKDSFFIDYGIKYVMCSVFPNITEMHDAIALQEQPYRVAINNINEVTYEEYFENLTDTERDATRKEYYESVLGDIKVLDDDEMRELGLDEDRLEEIQFAVGKSIAQSVDFDVLIMRFISSVVKQFAEREYITPPQEYFDRFDVKDTDTDKQTYDEMVMAYKVDLAKLADRFDTLIDTLDDPTTGIHDELYSVLLKLSRTLPGMWN